MERANQLKGTKSMKKPYAIIIMDGYGLNPKHEGNAVYADGSKNVTELEKE